jgi:hypothetical protein
LGTGATLGVFFAAFGVVGVLCNLRQSGAELTKSLKLGDHKKEEQAECVESYLLGGKLDRFTTDMFLSVFAPSAILFPWRTLTA